MENFNIVLFKNKKKKKILKEFITLSRAKKYYKQLLQESKSIIFEKNYENGHESSFEIAIVSNNPKVHQPPVYLSDNLGRNIRVKLEESNMSILEISLYKIEEKIFDIQTNTKITINEFISKYLNNNNYKLISSLNNKVIVQSDEIFNLFSLKNERDTNRFLDSLTNHFFKIKRGDCLIVKDTSSPQRKYLIELLNNNGFDKKILYRKTTTHPQTS